MDKFKINETPQKSPQELMDDACREMEKDLKPQVVKFYGRVDPVNKIIRVDVKSMDNMDIRQKYIKMFFDIFYYLPIDSRGYKYIFDFNTYQDPGFKNVLHNFHIETSMDKMPGTAGITRKIWQDFSRQLIHTIDRMKLPISPPDSFWEDPEEKTKKPFKTL